MKTVFFKYSCYIGWVGIDKKHYSFYNNQFNTGTALSGSWRDCGLYEEDFTHYLIVCKGNK